MGFAISIRKNGTDFVGSPIFVRNLEAGEELVISIRGQEMRHGVVIDWDRDKVKISGNRESAVQPLHRQGYQTSPPYLGMRVVECVLGRPPTYKNPPSKLRLTLDDGSWSVQLRVEYLARLDPGKVGYRYRALATIVDGVHAGEIVAFEPVIDEFVRGVLNGWMGVGTEFRARLVRTERSQRPCKVEISYETQ